MQVNAAMLAFRSKEECSPFTSMFVISSSTDKMVIIFGSFCYVFDRDNFDRRVIRLPSAQTLGFNVSDRDLAIPLLDDAGSMTILLWNFDTQRTRMIKVGATLTTVNQTFNWALPVSVFPNLHSDTVGLFYYFGSYDGKTLSACYLRCSNTGALIVRRHYSVEYDKGTLIPSCRPCGDGKFMMLRCSTQHANVQTSCMVLTLDLDGDDACVIDLGDSFDCDRVNFDDVIMWKNVTCLAWNRVAEDHRTRWSFPFMLLRWSECSSQPEYYLGDEPNIERPMIAKVSSRSFTTEDCYKCYGFHGNEFLMVIQAHAGISVYSFDPDLDFGNFTSLLDVKEFRPSKDIFDDIYPSNIASSEKAGEE